MSLEWDPVLDLVASFQHQCTPFQEETLEEEARQLVTKNRVYTCPHSGNEDAVFEKMKSYIMGPGHEEPSDAKDIRLENVVDVLTDEENLTLANSRVIASIVNMLRIWLNFYNDRMHDSFRIQIMEEWAQDKFTRLWEEAGRYSEELGQQGSGIDLSELRFFCAFIADLHSECVFDLDTFHWYIDAALPCIKSPAHFNVFLFDFIARGLTGRAHKLQASMWCKITMKWDSLKSLYKPHDVLGAVVLLFYKDSMVENQVRCRLPWSIWPSESADRLCEKLAEGVRREKERDDKAMKEVQDLVDAMDRVELDCDMDDLSESFQDVSMN